MICPFLSIQIFSLPEIFETQNASLAKFFRSCEIEKISTKPWSFPLCLKIFDTRILSKHRSVLLRILSALWDKNFSTEFSDIPFLCIKFCDTRNFLKHRSVSQRNFSVLCDKKFSTEKRDTTPPPPFLMHKTFRYPKFSDKPKCPQRNFSVLWEKKTWTKSRVTPLLHKI